MSLWHYEGMCSSLLSVSGQQFAQRLANFVKTRAGCYWERSRKPEERGCLIRLLTLTLSFIDWMTHEVHGMLDFQFLSTMFNHVFVRSEGVETAFLTCFLCHKSQLIGPLAEILKRRRSTNCAIGSSDCHPFGWFYPLLFVTAENDFAQLEGKQHAKTHQCGSIGATYVWLISGMRWGVHSSSPDIATSMDKIHSISPKAYGIWEYGGR
jgi:hypothetical protein